MGGIYTPYRPERYTIKIIRRVWRKNVNIGLNERMITMLIDSDYNEVSCISLNSLKSDLESFTVKKNSLGTYNLYGLMWWEFVENNKPKKSLVCIRSDNLVWDYNINININENYTYIKNGRSFLSSITRQILHNFNFYNIKNDNVLITFTILNKGENGSMKYNIYEGLENYIVKINVAGVKKDEIKVVLEEGIIKVRTNPKNQTIEDVDVKVEMFEPVKDEIEIYLPNIENVEATLEDGILILTAPKKSKGIKIEIK